MPWARSVDERLGAITRSLRLVGIGLDSMPDADKTVYVEDPYSQSLLAGTNGRVEPSLARTVQFVSSTGLFEVTVSLGGLVRDGAILGAGFESLEVPYEINYDIPKYGVVSTAPVGMTAWSPFAFSRSTVISTKPGVQSLALYYYAVCTAGVNSAAFINRASLTVKAV